MISEEQLQRYEDMATDYRYDGSVFKPVVIELIAEVRRYNLLQKQFAAYQKMFDTTCKYLVQTQSEADWLAEQLEYTTEFCIKTHKTHDHCDKALIKGACAKCWRQAAMDAFEDGNHD